MPRYRLDSIFLTRNQTCSDIGSCGSCQSATTFEDKVDCFWCAASSTCIEKSNSGTCESELVSGCDDSYYIIIVIVVLSILLCLCCGGCYIRKLRRSRPSGFNVPLLPAVAREFVFRNSLIGDGEYEWMCVICGFDNKPRNKHCTMCGTERTFTIDYKDKKVEKLRERRVKKSFMKRQKERRENIDISIPFDAQLSLQSLSFIPFRNSALESLTKEKRNEAINYRRLNQLSLRQKSARRRKMWQRVKDSTTGELKWMRLPTKDILIDDAPFGYSPDGSFSEFVKGGGSISASSCVSFSPSTMNLSISHSHLGDLMDAVKSDPPNNSFMYKSYMKMNYPSNRNNNSDNEDDDANNENERSKLIQTPISTPKATKKSNKLFADHSAQFLKKAKSEDSFGDAAFISGSPGYTSVFDTDGELVWQKVESGKPVTQSAVLPNTARMKSTTTVSMQPMVMDESNGLTNGLVSRSLLTQQLRQNSLQNESKSDRIFPHGGGVEGDALDIENRMNGYEFDLETIASWSFKKKQIWFIGKMSQLQKPWADGYVRMEVRRSCILDDTHRGLSLLRYEDLHKWLRIGFYLEPGVDAGGLEREWFTLITEEIFSMERGLFIRCGGGSDSLAGTYHINPISSLFHPDHLSYYKVIGRLFGKAIMEQQPLKAYLSLPLRKQTISVPITFSDLEFVDDELYNNLIWLKTNQNISNLMLDFTVTYSCNGKSATYDLKPNGSDIMVTDENKDEYLQLRLRHRMLDSVKSQLEKFLIGLYEVIPPDLLSVFDYQELDLLLCGTPEIDVSDWIRHTEYQGEYRMLENRHQVIRWFWSAVEAMTYEERVRLLQFTTGCARLPAQGFKALQSNDGKYRKFNIQSISKEDSLYPRAHTCFNKLDLPLYQSQSELDAYLSVVINMEITGFTMD